MTFSRRTNQPDHRFANDKQLPGPLQASNVWADDVAVDVAETSVRVTFRSTAQHYDFGRLTDYDDIARFGPLSRCEPPQSRGNDDRRQLEPLAYNIALRAIAN